MTNYMELLMVNQPWNLITFMVLPVAMAELITIAEFFILSDSEGNTGWKKLSHHLGKVLGIYFAGIFFYLAFAVVPNLEFRGWVDMLAVGAYMMGVLPLGAIALQEFGLISGSLAEKAKTHRHIILLATFLIVSHIAMVFGMVDPAMGGWQPAGQYDMMNHDMTDMKTSAHTMKH